MPRKSPPCWSAFTEGHVTAEGRLSACCFDATANWTMGDLNRQSFMEARNPEPFVKLRAAHLAKDVTGTLCEKCFAHQQECASLPASPGRVDLNQPVASPAA